MTIFSKNNLPIVLALLLGSAFISFDTTPVYAEEESKKESNAESADTDEESEDKDEKDKEKEKEKEKEKTIDETVKDFEKMDGLFTLYRDPKSGELFMEILPENLDREYIYFSYSENGVVAAGHFRGNYRGEAIFKLKKYYEKIEFVSQNTSFYFNPESPLSRSSDANISAAVLASSKIVATNESKDRFLIKLDDLLLSEALQKMKPRPNPDKKPHEQFSLGKLSKEKTRFGDIHTYPENINIRVDYVYDNDSPYVRGGREVTDPRAVTLTLQHSFLAVPDNSYAARFDDARVGYFLQQVTDLTSHSVTPYRDMINRWNLQKKNPELAVSEPVTPITWWIENTTPYEYRDAVRAGVLAWNLAFEKAGFKNAVVVKDQPDDAEWDAGDIRYNVLRWTSSPTPPFGGYGPSFVNPRTGQILGADIMLEDIYVSNRIKTADIFENGNASESGYLRQFSDWDEQAKYMGCAAGLNIRQNLAFASSAMVALGDMDNQQRLVQESIYELALHEVGHTLGLNHNMRASQLRDNDVIHDAATTQGVLLGSVMDYGAVNLAPPGVEQGDFYTTQPGPYDVWAIQFGYDPEMAAQKRVDHLARSHEPELAFGNDADDMRSAGKAIDPRINVDDMSSDAIAYADDRFALVNEVLLNLQDKLTVPGESWEKIRRAYMVLTSQQQRQARVVSRYIGGVYIDRSVAGQNPDDSTPYQPVPKEKQKQAMTVLSERVFAADAFQYSEELLRHLAKQRRGFANFSETEDPKVHQRVLKIQKDVLDHLMHSVVLGRITDTTLYGNSYAVNELFSDLSAAIFKADLKRDSNTFRQNLQIEYTQRLLMIADDDKSYDNQAKASALVEVERIESWMKKYSKGKGDKLSQSSRKFILHLIEMSRKNNA